MAIGYNGNQTYFNISQPQYNACLVIVQAAQAAWAGMVAQFAAENIAMGITQAQMTGPVALALQEVNTFGATGSLWEAYAALSNVQYTPQMAPFLTADRIQWMKNQIIQAVGQLP